LTELSPERQELLKQVVDVQERSLTGCALIFSGLRQSSDPEVVAVSEVAYAALQNTQAVLDALIDGLHQTRH
jgi:hypothetical protein